MEQRIVSVIAIELSCELRDALFCLTLLALIPLAIWAVFDLERQRTSRLSRRLSARLSRRDPSNS
jgi:hypothetical protein